MTKKTQILLSITAIVVGLLLDIIALKADLDHTISVFCFLVGVGSIYGEYTAMSDAVSRVTTVPLSAVSDVQHIAPTGPQRYPEGEQSDFYVENACITCGAPQEEAPDLIAHSEAYHGHCYFKKQPQTPEEIERAINAICVSCIASIRYGGKNEAIIKRLYEHRRADQCDYQLIDNQVVPRKIATDTNQSDNNFTLQ